MRNFIIRLLIFSIPLILLLIPPIAVLKATGENYTEIDNMIESEKKYLIGYAYNEKNYKYLKWKEWDTRRPSEILALGSSRVLQFRESMFMSSFYNAGYTISSIADFVPFLKSVSKEKYPKVLLISLDQWMFNENWDALSGNRATDISTWKNSFDENASLNTLIQVWKDLLNGKYGVDVLSGKHHSNEPVKIGLNSIVNNKGFRKDGSMFYGDQIVKLLNRDTTANDYGFKATHSRIQAGNSRFQYGSNINTAALEELESLLYFCQQNDIYVVAVLPPFADKVNLWLKESSNHTYINKIYASSNQLFKKYGFELWDMTYLNSYNSNDCEVLDGFHGSEVTYLRMLIYIVENDSRLKEYTDLAKLKLALKTRSNNYVVYN